MSLFFICCTNFAFSSFSCFNLSFSRSIKDLFLGVIPFSLILFISFSSFSIAVFVAFSIGSFSFSN